MTRIAATLAACASLAACAPPSDLNTPCQLTKPDPVTDGGAIVVTTTDPIYTDPTFAKFDFVSSGSSGCEDLFCVRVAHPSPGYYDDRDGIAHGRCSQACIADQAPDHSSSCGPSESGLACRQLGLDESTIDAFCSSAPASCSAILGSDPSASYCIDPRASAAGTPTP